ncbi:uncharacterized protein A4U43_C01F17290 [Asparagus officinalis]|uniref:Uncharacterized protein n=1 Tax=Asparagus officinalis TaxID=4686 RepID=A0A5P1FRT5_ASPOF|nr:uncharacterized protein LOC109824687 isoform X2 [Asparagus officinalis]ONK80403.1 uncharacterized protein A4U43_C01F17290 [Asparagus officinalis]
MANSNSEPQAKLQLFLQWLQANGGDLRGCSIKYCGPNKGFGIFSNEKTPDIVMVVPLDLAITPMRVLQDPLVGPRCRALFEEGDVDDRFLVMIFLMVERLRPDSSWKPYLDMLPCSFGNPLWFTESELAELKGTTLYRASMLQSKKLEALYEDKVKGLVEELLHSDGELKSVRNVQFEDFLWANSIFWTRALNIPFPHSYVFPEPLEKQSNGSAHHSSDSDASASQEIVETFEHENDSKTEAVAKDMKNNGNGDETSRTKNADTIWIEGLVPGIDFCNHSVKALATWEVDPTGCITGVSTSMYLILAEKSTAEAEKEISISYGNKGNEELLYLYGFCIDNNPDDFLMVHYPVEAFSKLPCSDTKSKLLEIQNAELRCLLPKSLLDHGFFAARQLHGEGSEKNSSFQVHNYSWSGQRKVPSYVNRLVFPQEFLTALRTIALHEDELNQVSALLEKLVESDDVREPTDKEVEAAIWEVSGDYGALQLLVDLLSMKMMELEEGSGTQESDAQLLSNSHVLEFEDQFSKRSERSEENWMTRNKWSSIVYRRGQKQLTSSFLKEAEHALELCINEQR